MESKSKKRKKRKAEKKKNLPIIDPEFIIDNQCWLPENVKEKHNLKTWSWFDIRSTHKKPETSKTHYEGETSEMRVKRIEIFPTSVQKIKLLEWMEVYRRLYNLTIANRSSFMKNGYMMAYITKMRPMIQKEFLPKKINLSNEIYKTLLPENERTEACIPKHCAWNAINDVKKAFVSAKANKDAGNIKSFRLRYKKASNPVRTMVIEPSAFSNVVNGFAKTALGVMKSSEPFGEVKHECRLAYSYKTDKFTLWKPVDKITIINHKKSDIIALDPGIRTFQNGYSPNGICYKFVTEKTTKKIKALFERIYNVVKRKGYKKFVARIRKKITNMVTDMHWKVANFLCKRFTTILVGNMSTTGIVKKDKSVLNATSKQFCIALSHYKFRERLISKAQEHAVTCKIVDESYTTQTCGGCGQRNLNVGAAKKFKCPIETCAFEMDRDYNAGRNIYLKALSKTLV
jgi:putative transposase